ncbi:DUF6115 domain-containing protein [Anaerobacillus sp. MEB173]|uniref:DUF6115 domain-containing protein n=1 Tax=Anaerobacillus sp. MEB173 TaxID=3383345 RepID=UPI003F92507B
MTFLLIISLILHLFTFFWIIILTQKIKTQEGTVPNQDKIKAEIEDLLVAYTTEMKEDNERLLQAISKLQVNSQMRTAIPNEPDLESVPTPKQQFEMTEIQKENTENKSVEIKKESDSEDIPLPIDDVKDTYEQSKTAQVFLLSQQGLAIKEIAKKLNMGEGEVELILKFYQ